MTTTAETRTRKVNLIDTNVLLDEMGHKGSVSALENILGNPKNHVSKYAVNEMMNIYRSKDDEIMNLFNGHRRQIIDAPAIFKSRLERDCSAINGLYDRSPEMISEVAREHYISAQSDSEHANAMFEYCYGMLLESSDHALYQPKANHNERSFALDLAQMSSLISYAANESRKGNRVKVSFDTNDCDWEQVLCVMDHLDGDAYFDNRGTADDEIVGYISSALAEMSLPRQEFYEKQAAPYENNVVSARLAV